jgi:hypothetical protein
MVLTWAADVVIPNSSTYPPDDYSQSDNFSDASQSLDGLLDGSSSLGEVDNENVFEALDESALNEIARDEMARDVSDNTFQEAMQDLPNLDSSDVDSSLGSDERMSGYLAAGAGAGAGVGAALGFGKVKSFVLNKISSFRKMPEETDNRGLDELLDLDDTRNAAYNSAYQAAAESARSGFGVAYAPVGAQSAA